MACRGYSKPSLLAVVVALSCACGDKGPSDSGRVRNQRDAATEVEGTDAQEPSPVDAAPGGERPTDAGSGAPLRDAGAAAEAGAPGNVADARTPSDGSAPAPSSGQWVLGYYAAYQRDMLPPEQIDWSGLTHLVVTRLKTDGTGRVQRDMDVDATNGPQLARELSMRAHQNGKKAVLLLGGAGAGASIRDSSSDANRPAFVAALLTAMKELGYDGLDLDWEDSLDYDRFIALARDLRSSPLAPPGLLLMVGGFSINGNFQRVDPKVVTLVQHLDRYNLMTYYPSTALAGGGWLSWHNCPLSGLKSNTPVTIEDSLKRHVMAGIPAAKLGMGVAFYAICYTGQVTAPNQSTEGSVRIEGGDNDFPLTRLFAKGGPFNASHRRWDDEAQVPYLTLPSPDPHGCRYISFDDEQSLEAKGAFSRKHGYGGVIVWTINQGYLRDSDKPANALTQALKRGFLDP